MDHRLVEQSFSLCIGGMSFLFCPDRAMTFPEPSGCYREFFSLSLPESPDFRAAIITGSMPDLATVPTAFNADDAWVLKNIEGVIYFEGRGPKSLKTPPWIIELRDDRSAAVFGNSDVQDVHGSVICPIMYPVDQLICVNLLASRAGMIVHCAGVMIAGSIYLFVGRSGAGKSTLSQLLRGHPLMQVLSDDRMVVRKINSETVAFGTPWPGDAGFARNGHAPLAGVFFLEHGSENACMELNRSEVAERLMKVVSVPWYDEARSGLVMKLIGEISETFKGKVLTFSPDDRVAEFICRMVKG